MTSRLHEIDEKILNELDPIKLRKYADEYEAAGDKPLAILLRKRALLKELPASVKEERRQRFVTALKSRDIDYINQVADWFEEEGAIASAKHLRDRVRQLSSH